MSEAIDLGAIDIAVLKRICKEYEGSDMPTLNAAALALACEMIGREYENHSEKD